MAVSLEEEGRTQRHIVGEGHVTTQADVGAMLLRALERQGR